MGGALTFRFIAVVTPAIEPLGIVDVTVAAGADGCVLALATALTKAGPK